MTHQDSKSKVQQKFGETKDSNLSSAESLASLEALVDELLKEAPEQERVQTMMQELGLPFQADPIAQLNTVLQALHGPLAERERGQDANL